MNSLRRLLAEVPQLEATLNIWAGGLHQNADHGRQVSQSQGPPSPTQGEYALARIAPALACQSIRTSLCHL